MIDLHHSANALTAPPAIVIEPMVVADLDATLDMLSRGMRDNPVHVAVFGTDPVKRQRLVRRLFGLMAKNPEILRHAHIARQEDGAIAGMYGAFAPGSCQPRRFQQVVMLPALLSLGLGNGRRVLQWLGAWSKQDPGIRHWHVAPLAVDTHLQGQGIGTALMRHFCARMDELGDAAYLETDKEINVRFYERFGFEIIAQEPVLATTCWYMLRTPR